MCVCACVYIYIYIYRHTHIYIIYIYIYNDNNYDNNNNNNRTIIIRLEDLFEIYQYTNTFYTNYKYELLMNYSLYKKWFR